MFNLGSYHITFAPKKSSVIETNYVSNPVRCDDFHHLSKLMKPMLNQMKPSNRGSYDLIFEAHGSDRPTRLPLFTDSPLEARRLTYCFNQYIHMWEPRSVSERSIVMFIMALKTPYKPRILVNHQTNVKQMNPK